MSSLSAAVKSHPTLTKNSRASAASAPFALCRVVDVEQIDVVAVAHLASTEAAGADDGERAGRLLARLSVEPLLHDDGEREIDGHGRDVRQLRRRGLHGFVTEQIARADAQRLAALPAPKHVEPLDGIVDGRKRRHQLFLVILPIGRAPLDLRDQPVKVFGRPDEDVRKLRRGAHHVGQHVQRAGILAKIVEEHRASAARRHVVRNRGDGGVGIGRFENRRQQIGCETAERLAHDEVVGHPLEVLVYRRGIAKAQRLKVRARLLFCEVRREEEIGWCRHCSVVSRQSQSSVYGRQSTGRLRLRLTTVD